MKKVAGYELRVNWVYLGYLSYWGLLSDECCGAAAQDIAERMEHGATVK